MRSKNTVAVLLSQDASSHSFRFRTETAGKETLHFAFAHKTTGMVVAKNFEVSAVEWDE